MAILETLKKQLEEEFPDAVADLELIDDRDQPEFARIGGNLIWPGFAGMTHIKRQRMLGNFKDAHLSREEQHRLSVILTFTPEEVGELMAA